VKCIRIGCAITCNLETTCCCGTCWLCNCSCCWC
jgi:hypothetical protein